MRGGRASGTRGALRRNAVASGLEVAVAGLGLFVIYRAVVQELGLGMLGVWSLLLATTAFGRVADLGIAAGLARFVARALAEGDRAGAALFGRTALVAVAIGMGAVAAAALWPLSRALGLALGGADLALARGLLPGALLVFWLGTLRAVVDACLLGAHRADLRAVASVAGMAVQVGVALSLVGTKGLGGLVGAQAAAAVVALALGLVLVRRALAVPRDAAAPWVSGAALREMLGLGLRLQVGTLATLLVEPLCKIVLGAVGGTALLGVFEMAQRMVYQVRSVAIMALQSTVPEFARIEAEGGETLDRLFGRVCRAAAVTGAGLMAVLAVASPLVSWLWLGRVDPLFVLFTGVLSVGWAVNILAAPAFFLGIARGRVMPGVLGQVLSGVVAPLAVLGIGAALGPVAAVLGVVLGKIPGDLVPAVWTRPGGSWRQGTLAQPAVLRGLALVLVAGGGMAGLAAVRL